MTSEERDSEERLQALQVWLNEECGRDYTINELKQLHSFYRHDESIDEWVVIKLATLGFTVDKELHEIRW
jgi:hypothetical protein